MRMATSPVDFPDSPVAQIMKQPLLLGLFLPIQSDGWSPSSLPRSTSWEFDYNARLTQRAEEFGFDLAFGLAQWLGKGGIGGAINFREQSLDPFITATSLACILHGVSSSSRQSTSCTVPGIRSISPRLALPSITFRKADGGLTS